MFRLIVAETTYINAFWVFLLILLPIKVDKNLNYLGGRRFNHMSKSQAVQ